MKLTGYEWQINRQKQGDVMNYKCDGCTGMVKLRILRVYWIGMN